MAGETDIVVKFSRVGWNKNVPDLKIVAGSSPDEMAEVVCRHAKRYLASYLVETIIDVENMRGEILVGGFRPVGEFTLVHAHDDEKEDTK